jgi:hypothetical protein
MYCSGPPTPVTSTSGTPRWSDGGPARVGIAVAVSTRHGVEKLPGAVIRAPSNRNGNRMEITAD